MARQRLFSRRNTAPARASTIDELAKLRRGGFSTFATQTGEEAPNILPGMRIVSAPQQQIRSTRQQEMTPAPVYPDIQQDQTQQGNQGGVLGASTGQDLSSFLQQLTQDVYQPQQGTDQNYLEALYKTTGTTYGIASLQDGRILMNDGSVRDPNQEIFPVASDRSGGVIMSDGSVRTIDPRIASLLGQSGTSGISNLLFGQNQVVTQPFGNINPIEPTPGNVNLGTDFRTRDLPQQSYQFPLSAEVVQVFQDDGTRFGDRSGHQGYGNSVLLRLPTGEMMRLSHLATLPDVQVGQRVGAGQLQITPGSTGNTTGEHLDLEYYNKQGQIDNPANFRITPELITASAQPQAPQQVPEAPRAQEQTIQASLPQQQAPSMQQPQNAPQQGAQQQGGFSPAPAPSLPTRIANTIENANPTGNLGVGASELLRGNPQAAGQELSRTIETLNPGSGKVDVGISEALRGDPTGFQNIWQNNIARLRQKIGQGLQVAGDFAGIPEMGISERVAGGATPSNVGKASAFEGTLSTDQPSSSQPDASIAQPGQGLASLSRFFSPSVSQAATRPTLASMDESKFVGSSPRGSNLLGLPTAQQASSAQVNDIRDPFFKSGQSQQFSQFLQPGTEKGSALSLDIFKPEFFQNEQNIASVFGGTHLAGQAQQKYADFQRQEAERRAAEERNKQQPSLQDYLSQGKTVAQWFAETGRQGQLDAMGGPDSQQTREFINQSASGQSEAPTVSQVQQQQKYGNPQTQQVTLPSGRVVTAPQGQNIRVDSSGGAQLVSSDPLRGTPIAGRSAQLNTSAIQNRPSLFSSISRSISRLFGR